MKYILILFILLSINSFASKRPNIVLVMIDDLGAEAFTCYGGEAFKTPHTDSLAKKGMLFESAFSSPACM